MSVSSLVLPEWQDDSEVSACPICKGQFHFLFRKHHCRRCGRIICDQCSPHRITIPRQYIVRPPTEALQYRLDTSEDGEGEQDVPTNPALGGGETVRVCNPCVPDPNYGPPPQHGENEPPDGSRAQPDAQQAEATRWRTAATRRTEQARPLTVTQDDTQQHSAQADPLRGPPDVVSPAERTDTANAYYHRRSSILAQQPPLPPEIRYLTRPTRTASSADRYHHPPGQIPIPPRSRPTPESAATTSGSIGSTRPQPYGSAPPSFTRQIGSVPRGPPTADPSSRHPALTSRREAVREEDECPVCGTRAPPFGPDGIQEDRERHINECIQTHLAFASSSRPPHQTNQSQPNLHTSRTPAVATPPQTGTPPATSAIRALTSSSPVAHPGSPITITQPSSDTTASAACPTRRTPGQRMLLYHATEKDATASDGTANECIICLEDFEPGDEMGRLECLCKFHRACIKSWWEADGRENWGSCPTHQLHD